MFTKQNQKLVLLIAIAGPIVAICVWIATYAVVAHSGETVRLRIRGYDPRDMLAGHYLRYTVDYGSPVECLASGNSGSSEKSQSNDSWCVCLDQWDGQYTQLNRQGQCEDLGKCSNLLRGNCSKGRFEAGIERFYFPEEHQKLLRVVPPESSIVVSLSGNGKGVVKELLVNDEPLMEWVEKQQQ